MNPKTHRGEPRGPVLEVEDLHVVIRGANRTLPAVRGVSFALERGRTLGIVGESGSGKSLTARAIMGLLPQPMVQFERGLIRLAGREIQGASPRTLSGVRGREIAMIFQDPLSSLNPVMRIGRQIEEVLLRHKRMTRRQARARAIELMGRVGIPAPERRAQGYPHQFSGGMRQRVMIAIAIALQPSVLIADEPTTALDVTVQSQILGLIQQMQDEMGMALLMITHDLSVVADVADDVAVMYAGTFVEKGTVADVFRTPVHPYTRALLASMPRLDRDPEDLETMAGRPPALGQIMQGCAFAPRCGLRHDDCEVVEPGLRRVGPSDTACHYAEVLLDG